MQSFKDKKVLIFGLGLNDGGLGMTEFFLKQGAVVTITDIKSEEQLKPTLKKLKKYGNNLILHLGQHIAEDFQTNDIIIRNPAIKPTNAFLEIARNAGKQVEMEMSFFHKHVPCPTIGITGTRGKSTTTALIYELLKKQYRRRIVLAGNIGKSAVRELPYLKKDNIVVLEISSFHLDGMGENKRSPHIAVVTNMYMDHIDWHGTFESYIDTKKNIFRYQSPTDYLVLNIDNEITKKFSKECKSNLITYSLKDSTANYFMNEALEVFCEGERIFQIKDLVLKGLHNRYNILSAIATSKIYNVSDRNILKVLKKFSGVHGRQQLVRELKGIRFYNDTTATSVEAVLAMFERFGEENKGRIVMIAGGVDKGLDYSLIRNEMKKYLKSLVLLEGTASEKIYEEMKDFQQIYKYYGNMGEAVSKAYELAEKGDMVILCPGGSSFNMFANEFDRGDQYVNYVNLLK
jgi:UDP-N-acetylmuramoylalanine--D-glutamate ligase